MIFAQIPLPTPRASSQGAEIDDIILATTLVTGLAFVLVTAVLITFCFLYRRRSEDERTPRILGSTVIEIIWTTIPFLIFIAFFVWGIKIFQVHLTPPDDAMEINVVGKQWMWKVQHPEGEREINSLHIPVNRAIKINLTSEDVIHDFGIPAFRNKIDAVPGRTMSTWYYPTEVGVYHIFCDQYCGQGHSAMVGKVYVMEQKDYEEWSKAHAEGSLALEGRKLFLKLQCISCHSNNSGARAPVLEEIYKKRVPLQGGGEVIADDSYIRESILYPLKKVHEGWQPIMPSFLGQVSEDDLVKVIAYIKSLRRGDIPVRTEQFYPPIGAPTQRTEVQSPKTNTENSAPKESVPKNTPKESAPKGGK